MIWVEYNVYLKLVVLHFKIFHNLAKTKIVKGEQKLLNLVHFLPNGNLTHVQNYPKLWH